MKKTFLLFTVILFSFLQLKSQSISLEKLTGFLNKETEVVAEELIQNGYRFAGDDKNSSFQKGTGNENFSIDLNREFSNYVQVCASKRFYSIYTLLETEIKTKSKKTKFFYSPWLKTYVTEYFYKQKYYIYIGQGICQTLDFKEMKFIQIASHDLKQEIFLFEG